MLNSVQQLPLPFDELRAEQLILLAVRQRHNRRVRAARVTFRPYRSTLYSFKVLPDGTARVQFHAGFQAAPDEVLLQAAHLMLCRSSAARRKVPRGAYDRYVQALPPEAFELPGARPARARSGPGRFRSLEESFARVNAGYFGGGLVRPALCWSPKRSRRILGSYQERSDRLIVSRIFDSEQVPLFVLDYLMFHELLHKFLGVSRHANGRRCMHGVEFRRHERRFERLAEVLAILKRI